MFDMEVQANYSIPFQRVWVPGGAEPVMNSLRTDDADISEPYMGIDAFHEGAL